MDSESSKSPVPSGSEYSPLSSETIGSQTAPSQASSPPRKVTKRSKKAQTPTKSKKKNHGRGRKTAPAANRKKSVGKVTQSKGKPVPKKRVSGGKDGKSTKAATRVADSKIVCKKRQSKSGSTSNAVAEGKKADNGQQLLTSYLRVDPANLPGPEGTAAPSGKGPQKSFKTQRAENRRNRENFYNTNGTVAYPALDLMSILSSASPKSTATLDEIIRNQSLEPPGDGISPCFSSPSSHSSSASSHSSSPCPDDDFSDDGGRAKNYADADDDFSDDGDRASNNADADDILPDTNLDMQTPENYEIELSLNELPVATEVPSAQQHTTALGMPALVSLRDLLVKVGKSKTSPQLTMPTLSRVSETAVLQAENQTVVAAEGNQQNLNMSAGSNESALVTSSQLELGITATAAEDHAAATPAANQISAIVAQLNAPPPHDSTTTQRRGNCATSSQLVHPAASETGSFATAAAAVNYLADVSDALSSVGTEPIRPSTSKECTAIIPHPANNTAFDQSSQIAGRSVARGGNSHSKARGMLAAAPVFNRAVTARALAAPRIRFDKKFEDLYDDPDTPKNMVEEEWLHLLKGTADPTSLHDNIYSTIPIDPWIKPGVKCCSEKKIPSMRLPLDVLSDTEGKLKFGRLGIPIETSAYHCVPHFTNMCPAARRSLAGGASALVTSHINNFGPDKPNGLSPELVRKYLSSTGWSHKYGGGLYKKLKTLFVPYGPMVLFFPMDREQPNQSRHSPPTREAASHAVFLNELYRMKAIVKDVAAHYRGGKQVLVGVQACFTPKIHKIELQSEFHKTPFDNPSFEGRLFQDGDNISFQQKGRASTFKANSDILIRFVKQFGDNLTPIRKDMVQVVHSENYIGSGQWEYFYSAVKRKVIPSLLKMIALNEPASLEDDANIYTRLNHDDKVSLEFLPAVFPKGINRDHGLAALHAAEAWASNLVLRNDYICLHADQIKSILFSLCVEVHLDETVSKTVKQMYSDAFNALFLPDVKAPLCEQLSPRNRDENSIHSLSIQANNNINYAVNTDAEMANI